MSAAHTATCPGANERRLDLSLAPDEACRRLRRPDDATLLFDGGDSTGGWRTGPLLAVGARALTLAATGRDWDAGLRRLAVLLAKRDRACPSARTGVAVVAGYEPEALGLPDVPERSIGPVRPAPALVALCVDRSIGWPEQSPTLTAVPARAGRIDTLARSITRRLATETPPLAPAKAVGRPETSLPREAYLRAVQAVQRHVALGDIYQGNLCQRLAVAVEGDALAWHVAHVGAFAARHAAFVEIDGIALASASPETFLRVGADGRIETLPIKGTRPRSADPAADRAAAEELERSAKDRAELLMIVDLERNDLGRVCEVGSVQATTLGALRSFAAVHHLEARVTGRLRPGTTVDALLRATLPGGSVTGAPKRRAVEILAALEPAARGWFTGSLLWFGDDGSLDSSLLIRSPVFAGGRAWIGAGGGVVADSDPEAEWSESNHKARSATRALGFEPEEAR